MKAPTPDRVPVSTYRLQFHAGFTFCDAAALVPYLQRLGVTECYCSPLLAARPGSLHGYDICDHTRLNPELGSEADFEAFAAALAEHNMGLILDFVPNHMSADPGANLWWRDVLQNGPSSPFAHFFDIDWHHEKPELMGRILFPILSDQYGIELEKGHIQVRFADGAFSLQYFDTNLPLNTRAVVMLLRHNLRALEAGCRREDRALREFLSILFQLGQLPGDPGTDAALILERRRKRARAQAQLAKLAAESLPIREHIERNVRTFNGEPGRPSSFDLLHDLLETQCYRLSYWQTARHEINYRRFFDINALAGVRMEDPDVFAATHILVRQLIRRGIVTGLRLDHVDGLFDPAEYFQRLNGISAPDTCLYIVAEKILPGTEPLRQDWAIQGTTGYDFLNQLNGLFVESQNAQRFKTLYARFAENDQSFFDVVYESKKLIILTSMTSELHMLGRELNRISETNRLYRDFTLDSLQEALSELVACFPLYRTYFSPRGWDEFDQKTIETALARALRRNPAMETSVFGFIRQVLLPERLPNLSERDYQARVDFAMKFQQYTGPVQAKSLEDTAFYRYGPLISLNEVGGDPARFGCSPEEFHQANIQRRESWPLTMLATGTHDTKWGEDARARINVLSEMPDLWRANLLRWSRTNAGMRTIIDGKAAPDRSDEYLFYQALLATWPPASDSEPDPAYLDRILEFQQKAIKEKKVHTSWIHPSEEYDKAMASFVRHVLTGAHSKRFLRTFVPFARRIARLGMLNSLAQVVLKVASPGVPDFFQGTELWALNFVDPDNRRPVDFDLRRTLLERMECLLAGCSPDERAAALREMLANWPDGRIKLYLATAGLRLRRSYPALFLEGEYLPLLAQGDKKEHVVAFARKLGTHTLIALAPRLVARLAGGVPPVTFDEDLWKETSIPLPPELAAHSYRNIFTHAPVAATPDHGIAISAALGPCPVAILWGEEAH